MTKQRQGVRTPEGVLYLIRQTAEKLLAEGVISGTLDGDLHASSAATVKAALMNASVCDFCSVPGASHYHDVPDFGITTDSRGGTNYSSMVGTATGGWMACDTCQDLIVRNRRKDLIKRAIDTHAFPKFSRKAIEELYAKFWQGYDDRKHAEDIGQVVLDFVDDIPNQATRSPEYDTIDKRLNTIARTMKLTREEVDQIRKGELSRDVVTKCVEWRKRLDPNRRKELARIIGMFDEVKPHIPEVIPHWQKALNAKFLAASFLARLKDNPHVRALGFAEDYKMLPRAQAYSFNEETIGAITEGAKSIPHDSPLSAIETPNTGAGWFWFGEPLKIQASPASDETLALLWGWEEGESMVKMIIPVEYLENDEELQVVAQWNPDTGALPPTLTKQQVDALGRALRKRGVTDEQLDSWMELLPSEPSITFTAYINDDRLMQMANTHNAPIPSTRWQWRLTETFHEMIARNSISWDVRYGPGGIHEGLNPKLSKDATVRCISELSLFFVMACIWFRQTVDKPATLQREQGPMERQHRKLMQKAFNLDEIPSVQVVALRRTARSQRAESLKEGEGTHREYSYRWIVRGHARMQVCGPGRKDRKLIWIDPHEAGPEDKPLKTKEKVYAVVR